MESKRPIEIDDELLTLASVELKELLLRLHASESALAREFKTLAGSPAGYALARAHLDALDGERRSLLVELGALAAGLFLLTAEAGSAREDLTQVALGGVALAAQPEASPEAKPEARPVEKSAEKLEGKPAEKPKAIVTPEQLDAFKAAFGTTAVSLPAAARVDDRTVLHGLAHHVKIAESLPSDATLLEEVDQIERATSDARESSSSPRR